MFLWYRGKTFIHVTRLTSSLPSSTFFRSLPTHLLVSLVSHRHPCRFGEVTLPFSFLFCRDFRHLRFRRNHPKGVAGFHVSIVPSVWVGTDTTGRDSEIGPVGGVGVIGDRCRTGKSGWHCVECSTSWQTESSVTRRVTWCQRRQPRSEKTFEGKS